MKRSWKGVFLSLGLVLSAATAIAQEETSQEEAPQEEAADTTLSPYFFVENGDPAVDQLPLKETKVDVHIAGVIADVVVTQVYKNEGSRPINARYVFPASTRAAVHGMTLQVGEHRVRAKIRERQAAQQEFKEAVEAGKSAALLEQERPNVFTMNVGNVMPGDEIRVELHYSELLVPTDGTYEFVYPTVVGPRYAKDKTVASDVNAWVKSPYQHQGAAPASDFSIETTLAAGMPVDEVLCPSHKTHVDWQSPITARITLDPGEAQGGNSGDRGNSGNRDYVLRYRLQGQQVETGLLLYPGKDESFFLLMVQPPDGWIARIVDRMLELARLENRREKPEMENVEVSAMVRTVAESHEPLLASKDVRIDLDVPDRLPITGNAFLLHQALENLVQNAIEFSPAGGTVKVAAATDRDRVILSVTDEGPGIPDYTLDRIFDRFYSLARPDTGKKSTGLGLNFVREVAKSHGGTIRVDNRAEGGVVSELSLPRG